VKSEGSLSERDFAIRPRKQIAIWSEEALTHDRATRDPAGVGQLQFRTKVLTAGKTATGIQIPDEMIATLGAGRKPAVRITINGFTYRSTVAVMNGRFMVGINAEYRENAKVASGDTIESASPWIR
jgi:hypothetical protein